MFKSLAALVACIFLFSDCASIVSKSTYPLSINSNPTGAKISVTDKTGKEVYLGETPATVLLKAGAGYFAKAEYQVRFTKEGYEERVVPVNFKIDGWYFGNLLFGGLIGMLIVDPATGAMWKIESEYLKETLAETSTSSAPALRVYDICAIPDEWKDKLVRIK
jgi:hypothetical protein